jgi:hypothetical protein
MATSHDSVVVPEVNYYDCGDFVFIFGPLFSFKQKIGPRPIRPLLLVQVRRRPDGGGEGLVLVHYFFVYCSVSSAILKLFITGKLGDEYWKGVSTLTSTSLYPPINEVGLRVFTRLLGTQSEHPDIVDVVGILHCLHSCMPEALPLPSTGQMMQHFRIHDVSGFLRIPLPLIKQDALVFPISLFTTFHFEDKKRHKMLRVPDSFRSFLYSLAVNKSTENLLLSVRCVDGELVIEEQKYLRQPLNLPPVLACALSLSTPLKYRTHSMFWLDESQFRTSKLGESSDKVVVQRPFPDTLMLGRFSITDMISRHINTMDPIQQSKVWNEYLEYYTWTLSIHSEENAKDFCRLLMPKEKDIGEKRPQQAEETQITLFTSSIMKEDTESDKTARVQNAQRADEVAKLDAVKDDGFVFQLDHPQLSELRKFDVTVGDEIFNILKGDKPEEMRLHVLASCDLTLLHKSDGSRLKIWFYVIDRSGGPVAYPHYVSIETGPALQVTTCGTGLRNPSYLLETTALIQQLAASGRYVDNYDAWAAAAIELSTISGMIVAEYKSKFPDDGGGGGGAAKGGGSAFKIRSFKNHKHNKTYRNKSRNRHIINKHKKHSRNKHKKHTRRKSNRK